MNTPIIPLTIHPTTFETIIEALHLDSPHNMTNVCRPEVLAVMEAQRPNAPHFLINRNDFDTIMGALYDLAWTLDPTMRELTIAEWRMMRLQGALRMAEALPAV